MEVFLDTSRRNILMPMSNVLLVLKEQGFGMAIPDVEFQIRELHELVQLNHLKRVLVTKGSQDLVYYGLKTSNDFSSRNEVFCPMPINHD